MIPFTRTAQNVSTLLKKDQTGKIAPSKYTVEDWNFSNNLKLCMVVDQQRIAERLPEDSRLVIAEVGETTKRRQNETKQRITEIQFLCDELNRQKKTGILEYEALTTYRNRVQNAIAFLTVKSLAICEQCSKWRGMRIGIDLCDDAVDRELRRELKTIKVCQEMANRTLKETNEQIRKLTSTSLLLDEDLKFKYSSLLIDLENNRLRQSYQGLGEGKDLTQNIYLYTLAEWQEQTYRDIENNAKEFSSASQMRGFIDLLLLQICVDMRYQTERTNLAFASSISQVKHIKRTLEDNHKETLIRRIEVEKIIQVLEQNLRTKERDMLLCRTRMSNRALRKGLELSCDNVHDFLNLQMKALQATMCKIQEKLDQKKALKRYLLHTQIMLEKEIHIKANTIKIDEVDCMTARSALQYTNF